jgi:hypothetical protein
LSPSTSVRKTWHEWGATFAESGDDAEAGDETARRRIAAITAFVERLQN